jgi:plasmid replication initiation protein
MTLKTETPTEELEKQVERLQYTIELHHNYYRCIPRSVHETRIEALHSGYRDFLKLAVIVINELKDKTDILPVEFHAFEDQAKSLLARGIND